jgi:RNA-directed DNA polymerase
LGFKTIIKPSSTAQQRHLADIAERIRRHRQNRQEELIEHLNRAIGGWSNYFSTAVSKKVFSRLDHLTYCKLKRWAERRHPTKTHSWVRNHYWHPATRWEPVGYERTRYWVFQAPNGNQLALHTSTVIRRHTKVKGAASPYDGDLVYWASRLGHHPELPNDKAALLKRQKGRCAWCGLAFTRMDELMESDHTLPRIHGGRDGRANRQLLHGHCHDAKTAQDGSNRRGYRRYP